MDDKRRVPYNIWINVIGCFLFLLIGSVGCFVIGIGMDADQVAVSETKKIYDSFWDNYEYEYTYDYDIKTISNWRDLLCRVLMIIVGAAIICLGVAAWSIYVNDKYWHQGSKCKVK